MGRSLRDFYTLYRRVMFPPFGRTDLILVGLPLVGVGLGQAEVGEDPVYEVTRHLFGALRVVVEGGDGGEDGGSCVGG